MSSMGYIYTVLGVMFFLMVVFGNNPMDEQRKKRAEKQARQLVEKIEEANKKKGNSSLLGGAPPPNLNGRTPGTVDWEEEKKAQRSNPNAAAANNNVGAPMRGNYGNNPNPFMNANPYMRQTDDTIPQTGGQQAAPGVNPRPQGNPARGGGDGYYPPPPLNKGSKSFSPQSAVDKKMTIEEKQRVEAAIAFNRRKNSENAHPNFVTDDGYPLAYYGTKVYTFDDKGEIKPMPDGKYKMFNGRWTMVVRGGEQTIANAETAFWRR